jgi:hypothetical protein
MMTDEEYKAFMFEEFKKAYNMGICDFYKLLGICDFYKLLMALPEENLAAEAKEAITFCFRHYTNSSSRSVDKRI